MGLKVADLLKWRTDITLKDGNGKEILDDKEEPVVLWLRIIGDYDLDESYKAARAASSKRRRELRDGVSEDYFSAVEPIRAGTREEVIEIIKTARTQNLASEAVSNVERPPLPEIAEVAVDPDAPTLEEQEKLDQMIAEGEAEYLKALGEYQVTRAQVIEAEIQTHSTEELKEIAEQEVADIVALSTFIVELTDQKIYRATYLDKTCRNKAFEDVMEFKQTDDIIRQQLIERYGQLEQSPDEIKN